MVTKPKETKTKMICGHCGVPFTGKKCPECGNTKGNEEAAPDGIPLTEHRASSVFGDAAGLKSEREALSEEYMMSQELAKGQHVELQDNLRESYLIKSKMKRIDLENELKEKESLHAPQYVPQAAPPQPEPQQAPMMPQFTPNTMNPQAQFMNHFMKFSTEERTEFLDQLAEADPAAMSTLSGFFTQPQQMAPQQMGMNPYMQPPMNPYAQFPPPWAQQQQYDPQAPARDPTEAAMTMVEKLQDMSDRNKHNEPSESTTMITELREELRNMNERISSMTAESQNSANEALLQRIGQMESQMYNAKPSNGIKEQIHEIKEMVTDLQDIGMMQKPESKNTVEEQIQLSEAHHKIEKENREFEIKEDKLRVEQAQKDMNKSLVKGLFQRQLHKSLGTEEETGPPPVKTHRTIPQSPESPGVYDTQTPAVVVEEFRSDSGTVRETRIPPNTGRD